MLSYDEERKLSTLREQLEDANAELRAEVIQSVEKMLRSAGLGPHMAKARASQLLSDDAVEAQFDNMPV